MLGCGLVEVNNELLIHHKMNKILGVFEHTVSQNMVEPLKMSSLL